MRTLLSAAGRLHTVPAIGGTVTPVEPHPNHLNLIYREEEREMLPLCKAENVGVIPYSPLAGGRLARGRDESTQRSETDEIAKVKYDATSEADAPILQQVSRIAAERGVTRAQIALAWLLQKEPVVAPIVGATKVSHVVDAVSALSFRLSPEEVASLEEPYAPHRVVGHS